MPEVINLTHTPLTSLIFVALGSLAALASSAILFYLVFNKKYRLPKETCILYIIDATIFLYTGCIYAFATFGLLSVPGLDTMIPPTYGNFLRPILVIMLLAPGLIAFANREN